MIPNHRAGFRCHSPRIVKPEPPDCGLISRSVNGIGGKLNTRFASINSSPK